MPAKTRTGYSRPGWNARGCSSVDLSGLMISERLKRGFMESGAADIEGFHEFLTVQNRRKSRAGQSLEHHLEALFTAHEIRFERGALTENKNKPDFLFPGQAEYQDPAFPVARLTMLGAKSTCKDRWRQVLQEANRIPAKHLCNSNPGFRKTRPVRCAPLVCSSYCPRASTRPIARTSAAGS